MANNPRLVFMHSEFSGFHIFLHGGNGVPVVQQVSDQVIQPLPVMGMIGVHAKVDKVANLCGYLGVCWFHGAAILR